MKKNVKQKSAKNSRDHSRLVRNRNIFEFIVRHPCGASAISGYRRAARHFGLHTLEDPCYAGSDAYRMLVHKNSKELRKVAKALAAVNEKYSEDPNDALEAEATIFLWSSVTYFSHDWKHWIPEQDKGALRSLKWKRKIIQMPRHVRVTITRLNASQ